MLMPRYYEKESLDGFDLDYFHQMEDAIIGWRDGLCPFGRLDEGRSVPATVVAAYAREVAALIGDESRMIAERPKILKVAEYADRMADVEKAKRAIRKAAQLAAKTGARYRDALEDFEAAWSKAGGS